MRFLATVAALCMTISVWASNPAVVDANNTFGYSLMRGTLKLNPSAKNVLVSPISAHFALSMALNGSAGTTQGKFLGALGYQNSVDLDEINGENQIFLTALVQAPLTPEQQAKIPRWQPKPSVLTLNNSAWATNNPKNKYTFKDSYLKRLKDTYHVDEAKYLDFKNLTSADVINKWTDETTGHMIPKIIDAQTLSDLVWVLLNTTYLEGQWQKPFNKPYPKDFTLTDGQKVQVPTMTRLSDTRFGDDSRFQVAEVAVAAGTLRALVILPKNASEYASLATAQDGVWSKTTLTGLIASLQQAYGQLTMPTFTFGYGVEMKEDAPLTQSLGLNFLFKNTADFTNMDSQDSPPSKVGIVKQDSKIEWNENGLKAAAATMVGGVAKSVALPRTPQFQMVVDHPFYFAVYDEALSSFLFLGQVSDPR